MAKTKVKKLKEQKIVDLSKPEKVSEDQLKRVQGIVNNINRSQIEIGMIETRKFNVLKSIVMMQEQLSLMQEEFDKQYGTSNIDITSGVINYEENVKANS